MKIKIGSRYIGDGNPLYFIADIAANHDGDIKRAFRLIDLAKEAGADAAKFQNFHASKIVSRAGFEALGGHLSHQSKWKKPVFEVYRSASIDLAWSEKLKKHCDSVGIEYLTSPYDFESVDHVDKFVNAYKIGSGDITWHEMLKYIAAKGKPVILATGASTWEEVKAAMDILQGVSAKVVLMQCNTNYTGRPENLKYVNLNVLKAYSSKFPEAVLGLSDHTGSVSSVLGSIALGARVFEKHFTDDRKRQGPDHGFSIIPSEWRKMVNLANEVYDTLGDGKKKIEINEKETSVLQKRALRYTRNIRKNEILRKKDLFPLRPVPDGALPPYKINEIVGKRIVRDVKKEECVLKGDIENVKRKKSKA